MWSPDGKHLYFASDRGGQMNLWRVAIEEKTGIVKESPESITTPSPYAQHLSFSRDGRRAVYVSEVSSKNILKADFNPDTAVTGEPIAITQGFKHTAQPNLSPDGEWFVYSTQDEQQEDLFIIDKDGASPPRQLTDDHFKDRHPRWSPDGKRIVFIQIVAAGTKRGQSTAMAASLQQMTFTTGLTVIYSFWSPTERASSTTCKKDPAGSLMQESHGASRRRNACLTRPTLPTFSGPSPGRPMVENSAAGSTHPSSMPASSFTLLRLKIRAAH